VTSLPPKLTKKILDRFDELIVEGEAIQKAIKKIPGKPIRSFIGRGYLDGEVRNSPDTYKVDWEDFVKWRTSVKTLLAKIIKPEHTHSKTVESFSELPNKKGGLEYGISILRSLREDFAKGFLVDLKILVEAEIASDYMGQATSLITEGQSGKFDHVPAAVLAGAVLEKSLRTLCVEQTAPIPVAKENGAPKALNILIDDLKKAAVYNETKAKQLRHWAAIRNNAAHGEFDKFDVEQVKQMVEGIKLFLEAYLK